MQSKAKEQRLAVLHHRIEQTASRLAELRRIESRFPWLRLGALLVGLLVVYLAFQLISGSFEWLSALLALAGFVWVALRHLGVIERIERLEAFERLLRSHAARMTLDWEHIPQPTDITVGADHPYAADLDITGERSLHQLLDTTISLGGSRKLAGWLLDPAPRTPQASLAALTLIEQIHDRHQLVGELLERPAFRLRLELDGMVANPFSGNPLSGGRWNAEGLLRWLESHRALGSLKPVLTALSLLAVSNWVLFALNALNLLPPLWIGTFVLYFGLQALKFRESSEVFDEAYTLARQLDQLRVVLSDLEDYPYSQTGRLAELCGPVCGGEQRPSNALRRIGRIASAASLRNNPFLSLALNILGPWDMFFAYQLERYKQALRGHLPGWLETWYQLEALAALANFAAHNPESVFPEILPPASQPVFSGSGIGHPLIPDAVRVNNDFMINGLGEVTIITGSNMSGKSTFLRTVGVNLALAYAGSKVNARQLRVVPFRLFTSMNVSDSLSDGISFFYAEVRRLKALLSQLDEEHALPLFFLIDEIFRGTNNRERQLGSRAYTQALAGRHGVGLISTHDLELAHLAESIPAVQNKHFREEVEGEKMVFDYKIHPGASPTTNALRIMALAGLPVPNDV